MKIFVTGASGFIGRHVVQHLTATGHRIAALARSQAAAAKLPTAGVEVQSGDVADADALRRGIEGADAAIHLAFDHDFSRFEESSAVDRQAIEALGAAMAGTAKLLIAVTGLAGVMPPPQVVTEHDRAPDNPHLPRVTEQTTLKLASKGVNACLVRLAQIHHAEKQGLVSRLIHIAREKGVSGYVGDGRHRWPAAHVDDTARLFGLVLHRGAAGGIYHAVAEQGVELRAIAERIGGLLGVPTRAIAGAEARDHFGPLSPFVGMDMPASATLTRTSLGWEPTGDTLLETLAHLGTT